MLTGRRSRAGREGAFTLIELVVGMILLVIVLGGLVYAVTQLGKGNGEAMADRASQRQALDAMEQLRTDVRAARSPAMDEWDGRRETLREVIRFRVDNASPGTPDRAHQVCSGLRFVDCVQDVTHASSRQLWLRADVRNGAGWNGTECIGYVIDGAALTRYLSRNWRGCGPGAGGSATRLIEARDIPAAFSYTLRYHPTMVMGQIADPNGCVTYPRQAAVPAGRLNFITSVDVDLSGLVVERGTAAATGLRTSVQVTGRVGGDYAYATGCSY